MTKEEQDSRRLRAKVKETLEAVRKTIARTHAVVDRARELLQELEEARQHHRAVAERRAELQRPPHSDPPPSPAPQGSPSPPEPLPSAEPPIKNGSA